MTFEPLTEEERDEVEGVLASTGLEIHDNGNGDGDYVINGDVDISNLVPKLIAAGWTPRCSSQLENSILDKLIRYGQKISSKDCINLLTKKFGGKPEDWKRKSKKTEKVTVRVFINSETGECATVLEHNERLTVECHMRMS